MVRKLSVEGNWISKTLNEERKRGSTGLRAPPGGPMAPKTCRGMLLRRVKPVRGIVATWQLQRANGDDGKTGQQCGERAESMLVKLEG